MLKHWQIAEALVAMAETRVAAHLTRFEDLDPSVQRRDPFVLCVDPRLQRCDLRFQFRHLRLRAAALAAVKLKVREFFGEVV